MVERLTKEGGRADDDDGDSLEEMVWRMAIRVKPRTWENECSPGEGGREEVGGVERGSGEEGTATAGRGG